MKVAIIGYSGSGKSTLAAWLGRKYTLPVLHLDCVYWLPGWNESELDTQLETLRNFVASNNSWVIDGNYSKLDYWERMAAADRIIFMDFNRISCFARAFRRHLKYRGRTRESITQGCDEKFDMEFMMWILRDGRTAQSKERYKRVCADYSDKVTVIRNQRQLDRFMREIDW